MTAAQRLCARRKSLVRRQDEQPSFNAGATCNYATKYLELIEPSLTGSLLPPDTRGECQCHPDRPVKLPEGRKVTDQNAGTCYAVNTGSFNTHRLLIGRDWPTHGVTMVGHARLRNIRTPLSTTP